jgi:hypothetical protein
MPFQHVIHFMDHDRKPETVQSDVAWVVEGDENQEIAFYTVSRGGEVQRIAFPISEIEKIESPQRWQT